MSLVATGQHQGLAFLVISATSLTILLIERPQESLVGSISTSWKCKCSQVTDKVLELIPTHTHTHRQRVGAFDRWNVL